jgi:hypothetical protein
MRTPPIDYELNLMAGLPIMKLPKAEGTGRIGGNPEGVMATAR